MARRRPHRRIRRRDIDVHRVNFETPIDLFEGFNAAVPRGFRGKVMRAVCWRIIAEVDANGTLALHKIMAGEFDFTYSTVEQTDEA